MRLLVNKSLIVNGNFRDFSKRGPGICHLQNVNSSRWPWSPARSHPHREQHHGGWLLSSAVLPWPDPFKNLILLKKNLKSENFRFFVFFLNFQVKIHSFILLGLFRSLTFII